MANLRWIVWNGHSDIHIFCISSHLLKMIFFLRFTKVNHHQITIWEIFWFYPSIKQSNLRYFVYLFVSFYNNDLGMFVLKFKADSSETSVRPFMRRHLRCWNSVEEFFLDWHVLSLSRGHLKRWCGEKQGRENPQHPRTILCLGLWYYLPRPIETNNLSQIHGSKLPGFWPPFSQPLPWEVWHFCRFGALESLTVPNGLLIKFCKQWTWWRSRTRIIYLYLIEPFCSLHD